MRGGTENEGEQEEKEEEEEEEEENEAKGFWDATAKQHGGALHD